MKNLSLALQPSDALSYGYFVKIAYDTYKANPGVVSPTLGQYVNFPANYKLRYNIHMNDFILHSGQPTYYGFIAESVSQPNSLIIAIRGTEGFVEWWDDFHVTPIPCPFSPNSGNVTTGFLTLYNSLMVSQPGAAGNAVALTETVKAPANDDFNIDNAISLTVCGHSLGAALATLYGLHLASNDKNTSLYTYASPCVGDTAFVTYFNTVITASYRIYNQPDIVPKVLQLLGYMQVPSGSEVNSILNSNVKKSLGCFHVLPTYLYLLGAPVSILSANGYQCQA